jgi:hypothetical protein
MASHFRFYYASWERFQMNAEDSKVPLVYTHKPKKEIVPDG